MKEQAVQHFGAGKDKLSDCDCLQDDPKFKQAIRTKSPEARLRAFVALCGSKRFDEETGAPQPAYRLEVTRIMAEFPRPKVVPCTSLAAVHALPSTVHS